MAQRVQSLTLAALWGATDPQRFARGREYVDYVRPVIVRGTRASRPQIDAKLVNADPRIYPEVARMLADMRSLSEAAGDLSSFEDYLADVRSRYARRTSLIKALQAKRL
jgi:hypothetical protein